VPTIGVVTDSTADFPGDAQARLGITMIPLSVTWDGDSYLDKQDLSTADFYAQLKRRPTLPKTSAPPAGRVEQVYGDLLGRVDHVVSVHLAGKLSATLDVARGAAERVGQGRSAWWTAATRRCAWAGWRCGRPSWARRARRRTGSWPGWRR